MGTVILLLLVWGGLAIGVAVFAERRGQNFWTFLLASVVVSPITMFIIALVMAPRDSADQQSDDRRLDRLQQVVALRDAGALTDEEFTREKERVYRQQSTEPAPPPPKKPAEHAGPARLTFAAECFEPVAGPFALTATYHKVDGPSTEVGARVLKQSRKAARTPVGGRGGLVAGTSDQLLWSTSVVKRVGGSAEETVSIRAVPIEDLVEIRNPEKRLLGCQLRDGAILWFWLEGGVPAKRLAQHFSRRLTRQSST